MYQETRVYVTLDREKNYPIHVRLVTKGPAGFGSFTADFPDKKSAGEAVNYLMAQIAERPEVLTGLNHLDWKAEFERFKKLG